MNRCKQCGKEIPDYKQFCNRSCAAKYNNKFKVRKPWTEEQKQAFTKKRKISNDLKREQKRYDGDGNRLELHCKYCGSSSGYKTVCEECSRYANLDLYRKLNLNQGSLKKRYELAFEILYKAYMQDHLSSCDIFRLYNIDYTTLRGLFKTHGVKLRTLREGSQLGVLEGRIQPSHKKGNQYHCGWHTTWQGTEIYYRSSYELGYAKQLDGQKIPYEVESKRIRYTSSVDQREHIAIPDFYLPETNELVEIKSSWTYNEQNMKDKFKAYRKRGFVPRLILEGKEIEI